MSTSRETTPNSDIIKDKPPPAPSRGILRPTRATATPSMDARTASKLSKMDIIRDSQSSIKSFDTAKKWLTDHEYVINGEELSAPALVMALLYLANGRLNTTSQLINGIRAAAICLDEVSTERGNPDIAKDAAEAALTELTTETTTILSNLAENAIKSISEVETKCKEALSEVQAHIKLGEEQAPAPSSNQHAARPSYASILRTPKPLEPGDSRAHRAVMAKEGMIRKQILIDGIEGTQSETNELTPKLLVAKANLAIDLMANSDPDSITNKPKNAKIISAKVLSNKGVVFEATNEETATWLKTERGAKAFTASIGSQANLKERTYHVVMEFVPTSLNDQLSSLLRNIEADNSLDSNSIVSARWMHTPGNWREDQRSAHAILTTDSLSTANNVLKNGIVIEGSRLQARKLEEEPKRCFKCQKFNTKHTAANCSEITNWCPNCAGPHSADECRVKNRNEHACIGCRSKKLPDRHAAWDKRCPSYVEEKAKIQSRRPEYDYRYYLSDEPWTWERKLDYDRGTERWKGNTYERQDAKHLAERWQGNTHERRREDPAWKGNAIARSDSGWGQRLGTGTLGDIPIGSSQRRQEKGKGPALNSNPSQSERDPRQPHRSAEQGARTGIRSKSRSTSTRRIDRQPQEQNTSENPLKQTTLTDWFDDPEYEAERIRDSQKEWETTQPPPTQP